MYLPHFFTVSACYMAVSTAHTIDTTLFCKPLPGDSHWPSPSQWQGLNTSISGRLLAVEPPGAVCHPDQPTFNNASCTYVQSQWSNSSWHAANTWSTDYNDDTCLPLANVSCTNTGYPAYAVEAISVEDVQAGVIFARKTGVRLSVKGTGHDFPGRSSGAGSLEIWTHRLRGVDVEIETEGAGQDCHGGSASVTIAAGMQWGDIYREVARHNVTIVGGSDLDVGIGGWIMGAGHSPLSSLLGLGADQVLKMEVVTADGRFRVINQTRDSDLFWAMRGGGGSTFAVMTSVTVKAFPPVSGTAYSFEYSTAAKSSTFYALVARFYSLIPNASDSSIMGYVYSNIDNGNADPRRQSSISGILLLPNKSRTEAKLLLDELETAVNKTPKAQDAIHIGATYQEFTHFVDFWLGRKPQEAVGKAGRLGSWLSNREALTSNISHLEASLRIAIDTGFMNGNIVAGPGVRHPSGPPGANAILPAWRQAYVHNIITKPWISSNAGQRTSAIRDLRETIVPALKSLAPTSGAYMNEADPSSPSWQNDYFGEHYGRLLEIKKQWDPLGVFWCKPCVGHELWQLLDGPAEDDHLDWGIGQSRVRICRERPIQPHQIL